MSTKSPARLFVLLAHTAPVGVILRRGPSDWVQMIHWDTSRDRFTEGQWFHGRIFDHRCDLSPNGKMFVYRAYKPGNRLKNPAYGDSWTAISKPPNFTAQALWVHWNGFGGGGFFLNSNTMLLNHLDDNRKLHGAYRIPKGLEVKTIETYEDESTYMRNDISYHAMLRDGWKVLNEPPGRYLYLETLYSGTIPPKNSLAAILSKTRAEITLLCSIFNQHTLTFHPKRDKHVFAKLRHWAKDNPLLKDILSHPYRSTISRLHRYSVKIKETEIMLEGATWADFDQKKRFVVAQEGKIYEGSVLDGNLSLNELADFNANQPKLR